MENKYVGYLVLGISILIIFIIFLFNNAMKNILMQGCPLEHVGVTCPAYTTIAQQTYLSLGIAGILVLVSFVLIFSKSTEKIIVKTKTIEKKRREKNYDLSGLKSEEKEVFALIKENKTIFQAELIEKTEFGKAKISRILDRLEGRGMIERRRRGMTNVVVLKD